MFLSPYDTTACQHYAVKNIQKELQKETISLSALAYSVKYRNENYSLGDQIMGVTAFSPDVPLFGHPVFGDPNWDQSKTIYVDLRGCTKATQTRDIIVNSPDEFEILVMRARLMRFVAKNDAEALLSIGNFSTSVYVRWIADCVARRLGLQPQDQLRLSIIVGIFYLSLFRSDKDHGNYSESEKNQIARAVSSATQISAADVLAVLDTIPAMYSLPDLCAVLREHGDSVRYEKFNAGLMLTIVGNSWFGNNSRELVAVSLEHPPTFIALLYAALTMRGYKNALLANVVERFGTRQNVGRDYLASLLRVPGIVIESN